MGSKAVAAIDCGTNSTRLLVVDAEGRSLERLMRITRLGQGVDETGLLGAEALERCYRVLREYREVMDGFGVKSARLAATSAARDATNGPEFLARAAEITGAVAEVIPGVEEARLSHLGATNDLDAPEGDDLIVDIGGGSTELALARGLQVLGFSMQVGCVRLSERYLHTDPPTEEELAAARTEVRRALDEAIVAQPALGELASGSRLIGLAGTVSTLAQLDGGISTYRFEDVHHRHLNAAAVQRWTEQLATESIAQRKEHPGMVPGREDVIVGGAIVLDEVMTRFGFESCLVSEHDILDGIAADLLSS